MPQDQAIQTVRETVFLDYTQDELNWQYDHSKRFEDTSVFSIARAEDSARVRGTVDGRLDFPYGPGADEVLDIFAAQRNDAPIVVYIHGGAWIRSHTDSASYLAETLVPAGITYIATNFSRIPDVTLDEMVRQNRAAMDWVNPSPPSTSSGGNRHGFQAVN